MSNLAAIKNFKENPTEEEKLLLRFYENREAEKKRILEQKKILALQLSQPSFKSSKINRGNTTTTPAISVTSTINPENKPSSASIETKQEGSLPPTERKSLERKLLSEGLSQDSTPGSGGPLLPEPSSSGGDKMEIENPTTTHGTVGRASDTTAGGDVTAATASTNRSYKRRKTVDAVDAEEESAPQDTSTVIISQVMATTLDKAKYPEENLLLSENWNPQQAAKSEKATSKKWRLRDFGLDKYQTLAMKVTVPSGSQRWSINIGPEYPGGGGSEDPRISDWTELLLHLNPRQGLKKNGIVLNDRQDGFWGAVLMRPREELPQLFGVTMEIAIQITEQGFLIVFDDKPYVIFEHRRDLSEYTSLMLELPLSDDYGNPEEVMFHQVWWGKQPHWSTPEEDIEQLLYGQNSALFVSGLPRVMTLDAAKELEDMLWELFAEYQPESVHVIMKKGHAAVKTATPTLAHKAVKDMSGFEIQDAGGTDTFILRVDIAVSNQ